MEKLTKPLFLVAVVLIAISLLMRLWRPNLEIPKFQDEEFSCLVNKLMKLDSMPNGFQIELSGSGDSFKTSCRPSDLHGWEDFNFIELEFPLPAMVENDLVFLSIIKMKGSPGITARLNAHDYGESTWSGSTCPFYVGLAGLTLEGALAAPHYFDYQIDSMNCIALIMANKIMDNKLELVLTKK